MIKEVKKRYEFDTWVDYYQYLKDLQEPIVEPTGPKRKPKKKKEEEK